MNRRKHTKRSETIPARRTNTQSEDLKRALEWVVIPETFVGVKLHGNVGWQPASLVTLALLWVWSPDATLTAAAASAIGLMSRISQSVPVSTYQGLTNALKRYSSMLIPLLWDRLHTLMEACGKKKYRIGMWLVLAMDGSRVTVPRTQANEDRFCKPRQPRKNRKKSQKQRRSRYANRSMVPAPRQKSHYDPQPVGPQTWLTLMWHVGLRVPWAWRIGPSYSSERGHVLELLSTQRFPENTLFCADAGFVGYDFWQQIRRQGHHFLVRVGGNVRLLKQLGHVRQRNGLVYCWPDDVAKRNQPPLCLRLLRFHDARGEVYLVTSVLTQSLLPDSLASEIYRRRWGIELQFRAFKQTYQRSKLRSRTPDCVDVELHWSLLGLWMMQLLAVKEQVEWCEPDAKTSVASVIRIIQAIMKDPDATRTMSESLPRQLADATIDTYHRPSRKKSRNYPRRKEEPSTGKPNILKATAKQRRKLKQIIDLQLAS